LDPAEAGLAEHTEFVRHPMAVFNLNCEVLPGGPSFGPPPSSFRFQNDQPTGASGSDALGIHPAQGDADEQGFYPQDGGMYEMIHR
jgi:hypothetical protein